MKKIQIKKWSHRYRYKIQRDNYIDKVGYVSTGTVQVERAYNRAEVLALALSMSNLPAVNPRIVECELLEVR